jgi:hypothetical protein
MVLTGGMAMDKFKIQLNGCGGELDCRTVGTEEEVNSAVIDIVLNAILAEGDTITISRIED